jgi:hypothetical protein
MSITDPHDLLLEIEQQIAAAAVRIERLRTLIAMLEGKGTPAHDQLNLLRALGAAQSRLIEQRERLARRIRERE